MMTFLFDEFKVSEWAYEYCLNIKNDPEVRKYITDSYWAYVYCRDIAEDPLVSKHIVKSDLPFYIYEPRIIVKNIT